MKKVFAIFAFAAFFLTATSVFGQSQLSLVDIITALRSKKATTAEKNQILSAGVKQRGVTFALNPDLEKELRTAGADDQLIASIRAQAPAPKPDPVPQPTPDTKPAPTPKPPDAAYFQNRGNSSFVMGEFDAAINDYSRAIELNPKEPTAFFSRAMAFLNKKNYRPAIADFDKVIELEPTESMAFFNRGVAYEKIAEFEKAAADMRKALELDAENEPAKVALQALEPKLPKATPVVAKTETATQPASLKDPPKAAIDANQGPLEVGPLGEQAVKLAVPVYPSIEKANRTEGLVTVKVTLDEEGKVVAAKAINGPKGLRAASEDAAKRSKFKPATVQGKPVKATGTVVYNFKLS